MSLQIFVAFSGARLHPDPISFTSPDALRSWISTHAGIPPSRQILMTAKGKNVKQQHLLTENEVFVYDKQYLGDEADLTLLSKRKSSNVEPEIQEPPRPISEQSTLPQWQNLFMARRAWALEATHAVNEQSKISQRALGDASVISRAAQVALGNLRNHVGSIQHKFQATQSWARDVLGEHQATLADWQDSFDVLRQVPARNDLKNLFRPSSAPTDEAESAPDNIEKCTLHDFLNYADLQQASARLDRASKAFSQTLQEVELSVQKLGSDSAALEEAPAPVSSIRQDELVNLAEEAETLTRKIGSDYEEVLRLQDNSKSNTLAARRALVHSRDVLPSLKAIFDELNHHVKKAIEYREIVLHSSVRALQQISSIESRIARVQAQVGALDLDPQGQSAFESLNRVFQLPVAYGSTLVESIRRTEWQFKMQTEAASVEEEMKTLQKDEQRRRDKWHKSMGDFRLEVSDFAKLGVEIDLSRESHDLPTGTREEVFRYLDHLNGLGIDDAVQQVSQLLRELDQPVKQRRHAARAFKNGSVYDAEHGLSNSSVLLHGEDPQTQALKDEKAKLEEKLRASDSRVRKLEDLLHRHSQLARPSSTAFGPPADFERQIPFPTPPLLRPNELVSRRSSTSSRRPSSNHNMEEKALMQRIVSLEADITRLQREAHAERRSSTESRDKMQEAESTKRDLMANFEAQRQEFDEERQMLDEEMHQLKIRLEETEEELDRVVGSRDHQKHSADRMIRALQTELEQLRISSAAELAKAHDQSLLTLEDIESYRQKALALEKQLQQNKDDNLLLQNHKLVLTNQLRDRGNEELEFVSSLQIAHSHLSPEGSPPNDLSKLVKAIEILSEGLAIHAQKLEDATNSSAAEVKSLEEKILQEESKIKDLQEKLVAEEMNTFSMRETLAQERSKVVSLRSELADEQAEIRNVRARFAAGETGSEVLKERVATEEKKVAELAEQLGIARSQNLTLEQEVSAWKEKLDGSSASESLLQSKLAARGNKAKELSQRLFSQNERLIRMLEQLGFSVNAQDDKLMIQRASKVSASTTLVTTASLSEAATAMKRTISGSSPVEHYSNKSDLETLYWISDADDKWEDAQFQSFLATISKLDADAAIELITKRYKDVETMARKYQKDSRAYREKSHRLQSEAHDKIAYRSFKDGDLALFLPTRNNVNRPWAAFNVGAPHYFLREQDAHKLATRDWLLARITKVEDRVVDLSRSILTGSQGQLDRRSINTEASDGASAKSFDDDNPFGLSDGLRWYLIDAHEEKPGAPSTPGLGKSTVAATNIDAKGSIRMTQENRRSKDGPGTGAAVLATKTLSKSLDSRRSSSGSKKGHTPTPSVTTAPLLPVTDESSGRTAGVVVQPADADNEPGREAREDAKVFEEGGIKHVKISSEAIDSPQKSAGLTERVNREGSPAKRAMSPAKGGSKSWKKLWSIDYRMEGGSG